MTDPLLKDYKTYPKMAHWFSPALLFKLVGNVILSSLFGQYADRRLMIAALDSVLPEEIFNRATDFKKHLQGDATGAVWFDFVADLGDGFDSTYAVASLLAKKELTFQKETLPRGQALIMGGDEVYPAATEKAYRNQLRQPYAWAFPDHDRMDDDGIPVLAIPGNHDWYDGLSLFLAFFCKEKPWHLGSWRSVQRRSYFAIQITDSWWLWATDIQLADNMDQPQADYFKHIAEQMPENAKIILCSAEPGWLYTDTNRKSWEIMDYAVGIARDADKGFKIPLLLSGDTHHYSRYATSDGAQFITSGGGGAFLHPTHQLQSQVKLKWVGQDETIKLGSLPGTGQPAAPACYPSMATSRTLVWRNLFFAFKNWDFSLLLGGIYFIGGILVSMRDEWDAYILIAAVFGWSIIGYTFKQEKPRKPTVKPVLISSALHSLAHIVVLVLSARLFAEWNVKHPLLPGHWYTVWLWLAVLAAQMGVVGFLVGGKIFGLNLLITCRWLRMNRNDAFSAFRLGEFNNFLRIRLTDDRAEVYAVGLDKVPERHEWEANPKATTGPATLVKRNPDEPVFVPKTPLKPFVIEKVSVATAGVKALTVRH